MIRSRLLNHFGFVTVLLLLLSLCSACKKPQPGPPLFAKPALIGADLSLIPEVRNSQSTWYNKQGAAEDMLQTLLHAGANLVRFRLWHKPAAGANMQEVQSLCAELRSLGMKSLISVHYSDTWADPAHQSKPEAWKALNLRQLEDSVYAYTRTILQSLQPDYIQIGNEINAGLLWPEGSYTDTANMFSLIRAGINAVRTLRKETKIVLHLAMTESMEYNLEQLRSLDYDIIGLSYYPMWHGKDLNVIKSRLQSVVKQFRKPVFLVETSYPFTLGWNDNTHNIVGLSEQLLPQFPATPQGQKDYLWAIRNMMLSVEGGLGFCYWGGEWTAYKSSNATDGSPWENQALWDFRGYALPAMEAFW